MEKFRDKIKNSEAGLSLVSILIALGIVGIVAVSATMAFKNIYLGRKRIQAYSATKDAESIIVAKVTEAFREFVRNGCTTAARVSKLDTMSINLFGDFTRTNTIAAPVTLSATDSAKFQELTNRCRVNQTVAQLSGSSSRFYTCFKIKLRSDYTSGAATTSLAAAANKEVYLEFLVNAKDFRKDQGVICSALLNNADRSRGLEIYYDLHWILKGHDGYFYKSRVGTANVSI